MPNRGYIHFIPLFITALILGIVVILAVNNKKPLITLAPTITQSPEASLPPRLTPTPTTTPTPKPTPPQTPIQSGQTPKPISKPTSVPVSGPPGSGYSRITVHTEKGDFVASVVSLNLASTRVITDTGNDNDCQDNCTVLPLSDYVSRNGGFAGVNGSYFCPDTYPDCSGKKNSYDFPVYNTRLGKWINAGNLFWNGRAIVYFDGGGGHYMQNASGFGGGLTAGIVNYPGLLNGGAIQIDDNQSGLSDKQRSVGTKVGIGLRGTTNVLVVVASSVNMQQFAYVFKALGADSALNLDTGGSTALWYGGYKVGPGRNLPNAIIFATK